MSVTLEVADAREALAQHPSNSIAAIVSEPPFSTDLQYFPDGFPAFVDGWMPEAQRALAPGGLLFICVGPYPTDLRAYLQYDWDGISVWPWPHEHDDGFHAVLYWTKSSVGLIPPPVLRGEWDDVVYRVIDALVPAEATVVDPFVGGGRHLRVALQAGRSFTGYDIREEAIEQCRAIR